MVNEMDSHDFTRLPYLLGQPVVIPAGYEIARGVVVANRDARSIAEQGSLKNHPHVCWSLSNPSERDSRPSQDFEVLVHEQHLEGFTVLDILVRIGGT